MLKIPLSAFIKIVVDRDKPGPQSSNFSIDHLQINLHERRSLFVMFARRRPVDDRSLVQLCEKQLAPASQIPWPTAINDLCVMGVEKGRH
jgi:hypothetical protein